MIYQLPFKDWMDLDKLIERPPAEPEEASDGSGN
jgi:hypothetical protein